MQQTLCWLKQKVGSTLDQQVFLCTCSGFKSIKQRKWACIAEMYCICFFISPRCQKSCLKLVQAPFMYGCFGVIGKNAVILPVISNRAKMHFWVPFTLNVTPNATLFSAIVKRQNVCEVQQTTNALLAQGQNWSLNFFALTVANRAAHTSERAAVCVTRVSAWESC